MFTKKILLIQKKYTYEEIDEIMKNGSGKYMGKCECTVKFLKIFFYFHKMSM